MRQFKNNLKRNRGRNHSDRSFKRSQDIDKLNGNFANNDNSFRRKINRNNGNVQKLISKYNDLAREALSNGDKILSENYLQHADHFTRILNEKESFKRDKITESKSEKSSDIKNQNVEDSDLNSNEDLVEESSDETNVQKNTKYQVEIN